MSGRVVKVVRVVKAAVVAAVVGGVAACNSNGGRTDYSESPDSGAVAPAMRQDTSMSRTQPDSTSGGAQRTGRPGVAGDTLGTRGRPVGTGVARDTSRRRP